MTTVKPGQTVEQYHREQTVYALPFSVWGRSKDGLVSVKVLRGDLVSVQSLPHVIGSQAQRVRVSGGSPGGWYEVIRISPEQSQAQSFLIRMV